MPRRVTSIYKQFLMPFLSAVLLVSGVFVASETTHAAVESVSCNSTAVDEASLASDDVTFTDGGDGICIFDASLSAASVTVETGVTLTHAAADTTGVNISTTGSFQIDAGGQIDVSEKGSAGGGNNSSGSGTGGGGFFNFSGGGAGYGGVGGQGGHNGGAAGSVYGDSWDQGSGSGPTALGSGGAGSNSRTGGTGGGYVRLDVAGTLTLNGSIKADGGEGGGGGDNGAGGGSGGSIFITTGTLAGSGSLSAIGGDGGDTTIGRGGGGGGGGRIYVRYNSTSISTPESSLESMIDVSGGAAGSQNASYPPTPGSGGNGTAIFIDEASNADLTDSTAYIYDAFRFQSGEENGASKFQFDTIHIRGTDATNDRVDLVSTSSAAVVDTNTATIANTDWTCSGVSSLQFDADTLNLNSLYSDDSFTMSGCGDLTLNTTTSVTSVLDNLTLTADSLDWNFAASAAVTLSDSTITTTDTTQTAFTIDETISLTLGTADNTNDSTINSNVTFDITNLTVYAGSTISANSKGCAPNSNNDGSGPNGSEVCTISTTGYGKRGTYAGAGAGHGGAGGTTIDGGAAGSTYDTAATPSTYSVGSSGARGEGVNGGYGGGYVKIDASGTLTLNGLITADGEAGGNNNNNGAGGGSGGSIWIITGTLAGGSGGSFSADGGDGGDATTGRGGGAGGGGLIYVQYNQDTSSFYSGLSSANTTAGGTGGTGSLGAGGNGGDGTLTTLDNPATFVSAITTSTTTIQIQMSEALSSVTFGEAGAWTATGLTATNAVINGVDNTIIDLTVSTINRGFTASDFAFSAGASGSAIIDSGSNSTTSFSSKTISDGVAPDAPGSFAKSGGTGTSAVMTWTPTSDTNFGFYEIIYGTNQTDVQNNTGTALEWSDENDANLATRTTTTTTITGLSAGATYYALICAYDVPENSGCTSDISFVTNQTPTVTTPGSISQATNGSGHITFSTTVADADSDETKLKVEYSDDGGSTFYDADLVSVTPDGAGTVDLDDAQAYQIGSVDGIDTDAADTTLTIVWDSSSATNGNGAISAEESDIQIRVTANDSIIDSSVGTSSNFSVDNAGPSGMSGFASTATTSSTITVSWTAASSESNFSHYEIWYGENQSDVENRTGTASEWDNSDDSNLTTLGTTTTTITGLSENTTYYLKIWAIDDYGNETTLSTATANNNGRATLSSATATQASDGSGDVTVQVTVDDADDDDQIQMRAEFSTDGGSNWTKMTLDETNASTSATYGDPNVENDNTYQVGNASGYITSSSGANTVRFVWPALSESGGSSFDTNSTQVRLTPYDATENGATLTVSGVILDNVAPASLSNVTATPSGTDLRLSWTAPTESNFNHYEIWYGTDSSAVANRTATEWDNGDDSTLAVRTTTTTDITGLDLNTAGQTYYFKIWAIDDYGNESTVDTVVYSTGVSGGGGTSSSALKRIAAKSDPGEDIVTEAGVVNTKGLNIIAKRLIKEQSIEKDTDKDGLSDTKEQELGTDPRHRDTDRDGISDGSEVNRFKSNPLAMDSDGDGFSDNQEILNAFNPADPCEPGGRLPETLAHFCRTGAVLAEDVEEDTEEVFAVEEETKLEKEPETIKRIQEIEITEEVITVVETQTTVTEDVVVVIEEEKETEKVEPNIENLLRNVRRNQQFIQREYDLESPKGRIEFAIDSEAAMQAPWSRRHFRALLKNEAIAENIQRSEGLEQFIEDVVADPNKPITQTDSVKLLMAISLPQDQDGEVDAIVEDFNEQALKLAEQRQLIKALDDLNEDAVLTRGQALMLLFKTSNKDFRTDFVDTVLSDFDSESIPFSDIKLEDSYAPYIYFFHSKGLIDGYDDGTFRINSEMTNAEFVKIMNLVQQEKKMSPQSFKPSVNLQTSLFNTHSMASVRTAMPIEQHVRKFIARKRFLEMFFKNQ